MKRAAVLAAMILAGCGLDHSVDGSNSDADGRPDARDDSLGTDDAAVVDAAVAAECDTPNACDWIEPYQRDVVARLAGAEDIAPGVRLTHRASAVEREHVRGFLVAELTRLGYVVQRHVYRPSGANVVARLAPDAVSPDSGVIVVGAHFDSVTAGPGAADNATGVAIVLAAARYFAGRPGRRHPMAFVLFDEEEIGLVGSEAFVDQLLADDIPVAAAHCFDMLSYDLDGDRAIELWSPTPSLTGYYQTAGQAAAMPIQPVSFTYSDHQAFLAAGLPAVGIGEEFVADDHTPHYHRSTDTFDKIDFGYLLAATHVGLAAIEANVTGD